MIDFHSSKMLFFGGKGGTGKTTCASASAIYAAENGLRTIIASTDQAHSLSDCFCQEIGENVTEIGYVKGLYALELDAKKVLDTYLEGLKGNEHGRYYGMVNDIFKKYLPPGSDEVLGLAKIFELKSSEDYDLVIVDTAPTASTLRLLELADFTENLLNNEIVSMSLKGLEILSGVKSFLFDTKYKSGTNRRGPDARKIREVIEDLSKYSKQVKRDLKDSSLTQFNIVTLPEKMTIEETADLYKALKGLGVRTSSIIINKTMNSYNKDCQFCTAIWESQRKHIKEARELFEGIEIIEVPLLDEDIEGEKSLRKVKDFLFKVG